MATTSTCRMPIAVGLRRMHRAWPLCKQWTARAKMRFSDRRRFCDSGSVEAGEQFSTENGVPEISTSQAAESPTIDSLERLKFWNLSSQMTEAIRLRQHDVAVDLLPDLKKYEMTTAANCNGFLEKCCYFGNAKVAKQIIKFMDDNGVEKDERSYSFLLGALSRSGNLDEALELLTSLTRANDGDVRANISMFNAVLNGCSSASSGTHAERCLELMASLGLQKDHQTYIELIKLAGKKEDLNSLKSLWVELMSRYNPVVNSYRSYIIALCRVNGVNEALTVLQQMLDLLSKSTSAEPIPAAVTEVFNAMINAAGKSGQYQLAESLFTEMNRMELQGSIFTYNALIRAVVRGRGVEYGLRLVQSMESNGVEPDSCTYGAIVEGYCKSSQLDKAENLLEQMLKAKPSQRPTSHAFNFLIQACSLMNEQERALRVFRRMRSELINPDICTYTALFGIFGSVSFPYTGGDKWSNDNLLSRIMAIESDMASSCVPHTRQSLTALMHALGTEGLLGALMKRLLSAEFLSKDAESPFLDDCSYNTAMYACIMFKQVEEAKNLFQRMPTKGLKPDLQSYNIMIYGCAQTKNLKYAYELLDTMKENGIVPDAFSYNSLIKVVCACHELEGALEIMQTMDRAGVETSIYTFNTIVSAAAAHGRIDIIEFLMEDMHERKVPPNTFTILKVMLTYIHLKRLEDAIQAVRVLSTRMLEGKQTKEDKDSKNSDRLQDVMQALLQDNHELAKDMTEALAKGATESLDPAAQALYNISLAGLATGPDERWLSEPAQLGT